MRSSRKLEREAMLNIEVRWLLGEIVPSNKTIAIDSFKVRAQNSLKNNYNQGKIDRYLDYIDNRIRESHHPDGLQCTGVGRCQKQTDNTLRHR